MALVLDKFIMRPRLYAEGQKSALESLERIVQIGLCHGLRDFIFGVKESSFREALRLSAAFLDVGDSSLPKVKASVRELLGDSISASVDDMTAALIGEQLWPEGRHRKGPSTRAPCPLQAHTLFVSKVLPPCF